MQRKRSNEGAAEPAPKKKARGSGGGSNASGASPMSKTLLKMKFMQRSAASPQSEGPTSATETTPVASAKKKKAVVGEPLLFGRRSFGGFNPAMEDAERVFYASLTAQPRAPRRAEPTADDLEGLSNYLGGRRKKAADSAPPAKKR